MGFLTRETRTTSPFSLLDQMLRWDPLDEALSVPLSTSVSPAAEIVEDEHGYTVSLDVPGVAEKDLEIQAQGRRITVRGQRAQSGERKDGTWLIRERSEGAFERAFLLDEDADLAHVDGSLKDGVLTLRIPRLESARPRRIPINAVSQAEQKSLEAGTKE